MIKFAGPNYNGLLMSLEDARNRGKDTKAKALENIKRKVDERVAKGEELTDKLFQEVVDTTISENRDKMKEIKKEAREKIKKINSETVVIAQFSKKQIASEASVIVSIM